jgi:DNA-binding transcriptional MerR regulator
VKIGILSQLTGVPISALRFYEGQGLLQSHRTESNYRIFPESSVDQVRRIQGFRALHLSLPEIKRLLQISNTPQESCTEVCELIQTHLSNVRRQIEQLHRLEQEFERVACLCSGNPGPRGCGILNYFNKEPQV